MTRGRRAGNSTQTAHTAADCSLTIRKPPRAPRQPTWERPSAALTGQVDVRSGGKGRPEPCAAPGESGLPGPARKRCCTPVPILPRKSLRLTAGRHSEVRRSLRRARRFNRVDPFFGNLRDPLSLHKYVYGQGDPVDSVDPSGQFSLAGALATIGVISIGIATYLPAIRGAYNAAYHVAADGTKESLFAATFQGTATWQDFKRVIGPFGSGASAGAYNALDTLTLRQISPLHEYSNALWAQEGLQDSWVGTASNVMAWTGTFSLYAAAAVWAWGAAGGGTMDIAVSKGASPWFVHIPYGANGLWQEAVLGQGASGLGGMTIVNTPAGFVTGMQITGIPVLLPKAVIAGAEAGYAFSCVTAAIRAFFRGWGLP